MIDFYKKMQKDFYAKIFVQKRYLCKKCTTFSASASPRFRENCGSKALSEKEQFSVTQAKTPRADRCPFSRVRTRRA